MPEIMTVTLFFMVIKVYMHTFYDIPVKSSVLDIYASIVEQLIMKLAV